MRRALLVLALASTACASSPSARSRDARGERVGDFDVREVVRLIQTRQSAIRACYERSLREHTTLRGEIRVTMTIQEDGSVTNVRATANSFAPPWNAQVSDCVVRVIRGFRFRPGPTGGSVTYAFPFVFEPMN